jgi:hypothetical protein
MISSGQYTSRSVYAGESRTAGQAYGTVAKKAAEAASFSKLLDEGAEAPPSRRVSGDDRTAGVPAKNAGTSSGKSGHFSFKDFILGLIDIINPLQHIPVVSTIYRKITGDEISPMARVAGDALYGGPIGAAAGLVDVAVEQKTGKDIGQNVMAMVSGGKHKGKHHDNAAKTELASAVSPAAQTGPAGAAQRKAAAADDGIIWDDDMQQAALKLTVRPQKNAEAPATPASNDAPAPQPTGLRDNMLKQKMHGPQQSMPAQANAAAKSNRLSSATAQAILQAQQVPKEDIAQKMMEGLDKYRAMRGTGAAF